MSKVLVLTSSYPRFKGDFAGNFVKTYIDKNLSGYETKVICPNSNNVDDTYEKKISIQRFNYFFPKYQTLAYGNGIPDNLNSILNKLQVPLFIFSFFLKSFFGALKSEIIVSHWLIPSGVIGSFLSLILRKKHICVIHGGGYYLTKKIWLGSLIRKFIFKNSTKVEVVSPKILDEIQKEVRFKANLLKLPLEIEGYDFNKSKEKIFEEFALNPNQKVILCLARLIELKGVEYFIRVAGNFEDIQFIVAGDGKEKTKLHKLSKDLDTKIYFFDSIYGQKKWDLLRIADIIVLPSLEIGNREEGTPIVALEALFLRKKVISTRSGGLSELLEENMFFESKSHISLSYKLEEVISSLERSNAPGKLDSRIRCKID